MPELPEVEIVARRLDKLIAGKKIIGAKLLRPLLAPDNSPRQFASRLKGAVVEGVSRRGKNILTRLSNGRTLITHLRMTGRFIHITEESQNTSHTHAVFWFDDGMKLLFDDQRHFGMMAVIRTSDLGEVKYLKNLAPEPFTEEFSVDYLRGKLNGSSQQIKLALLDQTKVVGLGNIYVSEALHRAKINPRLPAGKISKRRTEILHREIVAVLSEAVANDGEYDKATGDLDTSYGRYDEMAQVYEREGMACFSCGATIRRFTQGARSTYYCPYCQKN